MWSPSLDPLAEAAQGGADVGMDLGHMAIGASAKDGAVVSLDARLGPVGWRVAGATSPCLHGLLQWLLRSRKDGVARRVLAARAQTRVVQSALEDLLQAVLGDALLVPRVVHLLGCVPFPTLASIITHCARCVASRSRSPRPPCACVHADCVPSGAECVGKSTRRCGKSCFQSWARRSICSSSVSPHWTTAARARSCAPVSSVLPVAHAN